MVDAFSSLGFEVEYIYTNLREFDVRNKLHEIGFKPDLILQQENLGCRVFLKGLHEIDCLKIFWSVDTHLNMHWHGYYGSLFDGVLTTQKKLLSALDKVCDARVCWVPWMGARPGPEIGTESGIVPYNAREHNLTFVGRVSKERKARQWFVEFLASNYNLNMVEGVNYSQMMGIYRQTRIVPNEAIFGEVNFRLFEACSCGCAVVTPYVEGIGDLFDIGREIQVYSDVLELKKVLNYLISNPKEAASLALSGYERVMRDHLPENRAALIVDFAQELHPRAATAASSDLYKSLADAALAESGDNAVDWNNTIGGLLKSSPNMMGDAALMRIFAMNGATEAYLEMVRPYLKEHFNITDCYFYMSASLSAARLGLGDVAKHFFYAFFSSSKRRPVKFPEEIPQLLLVWGDELFKSGLWVRPGVPFDEKSGIPSCAADCYFAALYHSPGNLLIFKKLNSVFTDVKGAESSRLGFLSHLSLHYPQDWRVSLDVGVTNLKVFRLSEGITELEHARSLAAQQGAERFFRRKIQTEVPQFFNMVYG